MRRIFLTCLAGFAAVAFSTATFTAAEARGKGKKKYGKVRTLTITKRGFTDSGHHPVNVGPRNDVLMYQYRGAQPYTQGSRYGGNVLPGPFGAFGPR